MIETELAPVDRLLLAMPARSWFEQLRKWLVAIFVVIGILLLWDALYRISIAVRAHNKVMFVLFVAIGAWEMIYFLRPESPSKASEYLKEARRTDTFTAMLDDRGLSSLFSGTMLALNQITGCQV